MEEKNPNVTSRRKKPVKKKTKSFAEQLSDSFFGAKSKADKGTPTKSPKVGGEWKTQDERIQDYKPPGRQKGVSERMFGKKKKK